MQTKEILGLKFITQKGRNISYASTIDVSMFLSIAVEQVCFTPKTDLFSMIIHNIKFPAYRGHAQIGNVFTKLSFGSISHQISRKFSVCNFSLMVFSL